MWSPSGGRCKALVFHARGGRGGTRPPKEREPGRKNHSRVHQSERTKGGERNGGPMGGLFGTCERPTPHGVSSRPGPLVKCSGRQLKCGESMDVLKRGEPHANEPLFRGSVESM